ncbi:NAD(P)/FAD-dependent oxidoreductase [Brevibacillus choshinensis]|uniref:FAD-binding oxidoreductase n=1 Tax=Brevibacillus choshinensis TaxID=54911 RepID=A0ABX7FLH8_BRECH|nr:FAD-binding oxidoreductase [Brevibacillus choshinensis]QRG66172.1 FAD-binding oxidoreductase [Brevibacillus choshinensis]
MKQKVIVVGGGLIGAATTYYLSKQGADVTLIEAKDIASGTSGACDKAIMMQSKKPGPLLELALQSAALYKGLEEELEADLEYREGGGMILFETEEEREAIHQLVARQRQAGLDVQLLSRDEARLRQPGLADHILGTTWWDHDAEVNPLHVSFSMVRAAQRRGATLCLGKRVSRILTERDRVVGVECEGEKIYADAVVMAMGVWTPLLLKSLNLDIPILPRKGQILVSEQLPAFVACNILGGSYITAKMTPKSKESTASPAAGVGLSFGQTNSGNLLIGGSREFAGYDTRTSVEVTRAINQCAARVFPALRSVRILRVFSGLRPYTPDGKPILGPIEKWPGLYIAAGHEGDGVALCPITGKIMAEIVCGREASHDIRPFLLSRFTSTVPV